MSSSFGSGILPVSLPGLLSTSVCGLPFPSRALSISALLTIEVPVNVLSIRKLMLTTSDIAAYTVSIGLSSLAVSPTIVQLASAKVIPVGTYSLTWIMVAVNVPWL